MRVAITHATAWPWVRRGSERLLNNLSVFLKSAGYNVTIVTSSPNGAGEDVQNGVRRILVPQRLRALQNIRQINGFHAFSIDCARVVREGEFDAVHCLGYHEAWGILHQFRRFRDRQPRLIYQMTGIPVARYFRAVPFDRVMFQSVMRHADKVICLSRFARQCMLREFGRDSLLIPSPTDIHPFLSTSRTMPERPRILFCGDADEPRKGVVLLAQAFAKLDRPDVELHLSGRCSNATKQRIYACLPDALQGNVVFHGIGQVEDLPALYSAASVTVNPAVWEALGNVLTEALASGTPVVGCDHGGIPDIINNADIGALFAPRMQGGVATDADALRDALRHALTLAKRPGTAAACRERAAAFSWETLGPLYQAALTGSPVEAAA